VPTMLDGEDAPPLAFPFVVKSCTRILRRHAWQTGAVLGVAALFAGTIVPAAAADPIAQKQAQARAVAAQIDAAGRKEAALSEQYDRAQLDAQAAGAQVRQAAQNQAAAQGHADRARSLLKGNAVDAYVHGGNLAVQASRSGSAAALADGGVLRGEYVKSLASSQADALDQFRLSAQLAREAGAAYNAAQKQAADSAAKVNAARNATIAAQHQLEATLAKVKGDIATLVAQAQAAKAAAEARAAQEALARQAAQLAASRSRAVTALAPPGGVSLGPAPPVGAGAGAAVAAAMSRLGAPYVWGAAGPNAFDCSGLTSWAWAHANVSLPHFSGAQYASTAHISMSQLQPGDLVFPANPGDHVAMYIGGGEIIEAPHTGAVVHVTPMYSWFVLASRP
jgi:peptidoglycan DL-endopeptidase CwlO